MEVQGCLDEYFPVGDNAAATHQAEKAEKRAQRYDGPIGSAQQQSSVVHGKGRGRGMGRGDYYRREQAHAQVSQQFSHLSGVSASNAPPPPPPPHVRRPLPPAAAPVLQTKLTQRETPRRASGGKSKSMGRSRDDSAKEVYEQRIEEYRRKSIAATAVAPPAYFDDRDTHRHRY